MIIIAGGGISGLAAAYFLQKNNIDCIVLEQSPNPGGVIQSINYKDCLLESGPNSLLYSTYLASFISELGLNEEILFSASVNKNRFIYKNGGYRKLPSNPIELFLGNFFSITTKYKVLKEFFRKPGPSGNTTLSNFFIEHFGKEISDYALNPFVSGIYAGDAEKLLVAETFPTLLRFEIENGSILKGMIKHAGTRKKLISFQKGLNALPRKISEKIKIKFNSKITTINKSPSGFTVHFEDHGKAAILESTAVILALPAYNICNLLKNDYPEYSSAFSSVRYPPMTVVHTSYLKKNVGHSLNGFGALNPKVEDKFTAGSIWTSSIFSSRAPEDQVLFTTFVGGSLYENYARMPEQEIYQKVHKELKENFQINSEPLFQKSVHWAQALPQYDQNILLIKEAAMQLEKDHLYVCSNVLNGVSLEDCIRKGEEITIKLQKSGIR